MKICKSNGVNNFHGKSSLSGPREKGDLFDLLMKQCFEDDYICKVLNNRLPIYIVPTTTSYTVASSMGTSELISVYLCHGVVT